MPSSFTDWYAGLPKINRALLTSWVFFAVGAKFFSFIVGLVRAKRRKRQTGARGACTNSPPRPPPMLPRPADPVLCRAQSRRQTLLPRHRQAPAVAPGHQLLLRRPVWDEPLCLHFQVLIPLQTLLPAREVTILTSCADRRGCGAAASPCKLWSRRRDTYQGRGAQYLTMMLVRPRADRTALLPGLRLRMRETRRR